MPHIIVDGTDEDRVIQYINIHAEIRFSQQFFHSKKTEEKLSELEDKICNLLYQYFDEVSSETLSNHEYNVFNFNG